MIESLFLLLLLQLAGEAAVRTLGLPVPGPVLGMIALWLWLAADLPVPAAFERTAAALLDNLSLLFVPAAAGLVLHADRLASDGPGLFAAIVVSTLAGIAASALAMRWLSPTASAEDAS